jgi:hypothetical protein
MVSRSVCRQFRERKQLDSLRGAPQQVPTDRHKPGGTPGGNVFGNQHRTGERSTQSFNAACILKAEPMAMKSRRSCHIRQRRDEAPRRTVARTLRCEDAPRRAAPSLRLPPEWRQRLRFDAPLAANWPVTLCNPRKPLGRASTRDRCLRRAKATCCRPTSSQPKTADEPASEPRRWLSCSVLTLGRDSRYKTERTRRPGRPSKWGRSRKTEIRTRRPTPSHSWTMPRRSISRSYRRLSCRTKAHFDLHSAQTTRQERVLAGRPREATECQLIRCSAALRGACLLHQRRACAAADPAPTIPQRKPQPRC